jgi:hypothetical protein
MIVIMIDDYDDDDNNINSSNVEFLLCKLKHKLHMIKKNLGAPWRWPTVKAETCQNIN